MSPNSNDKLGGENMLLIFYFLNFLFIRGLIVFSASVATRQRERFILLSPALNIKSPAKCLKLKRRKKEKKYVPCGKHVVFVHVSLFWEKLWFYLGNHLWKKLNKYQKLQKCWGNKISSALTSKEIFYSISLRLFFLFLYLWGFTK